MLIKNKVTTVNKEEVEKFSRIAEEWWDENGKFRPLHKFNPVRISYIKEAASKHFNIDAKKAKPLSGLKLLDIGCGGGLLSVPMHRLGAEVTALDASERNILTAKTYADKNGLNINFINTTAEDLREKNQNKFDIVLNMEVIEHVENVPLFVESSCALLKENGIMFIATLNRTFKSLMLAKIGAEYILGWLPKGTHDWNKFLSPGEIGGFLDKNNLTIKDITGVTYNPFRDSWATSSDTSVNYLISATRK